MRTDRRCRQALVYGGLGALAMLGPARLGRADAGEWTVGLQGVGSLAPRALQGGPGLLLELGLSDAWAARLEATSAFGAGSRAGSLSAGPRWALELGSWVPMATLLGGVARSTAGRGASATASLRLELRRFVGPHGFVQGGMGAGWRAGCGVAAQLTLAGGWQF